MNQCVKCGSPIPTGQEAWMRRKSTNTQVPFCAACVQEVRQAIKAKQVPPQQPVQPTFPSPPLSSNPTADAVSPPHLASASSDVAAPAAKSSDVIPIGGALLLFLITLVGAPLLGGVVAFVARYLYLVFVFPFAIGLASGYMVAQGVRWGKVRDSVIAAVFGLVLGLAVYGCYRYGEYLLVRNDARNDIIAEMEAQYGYSDAAIADEIVDEILIEETGRSGFMGMVLLDAQEGMSITRVESMSDVGINIGTTLTWVYWLFELVVCAGMSAIVAMDATDKPFCEHHDRWYEKRKSLGGVIPDRFENTMGLLLGGDYAAFGRALRQEVPMPGVEFLIERCVDCQHSDPILTIKTIKRTYRGRTVRDILGKQTITPSQSEQILAGTQLQV